MRWIRIADWQQAARPCYAKKAKHLIISDVLQVFGDGYRKQIHCVSFQFGGFIHL